MSKPGKLFGGANQYKRFRKILLGLVDDHEEDIRHIMGIDPKQDIGVHSIRKGAATYVCSDTTCAPSIAAVYNCAGWTMCKVKDTYIQYEAAMDQYVGWMVAGLNINSYTFSVSPPHVLMQVNGIETSFQEETRNVCPFVISTEYQLITKSSVMQVSFIPKHFYKKKLDSKVLSNQITSKGERLGCQTHHWLLELDMLMRNA